MGRGGGSPVRANLLELSVTQAAHCGTHACHRFTTRPLMVTFCTLSEDILTSSGVVGRTSGNSSVSYCDKVGLLIESQTLFLSGFLMIKDHGTLYHD